MRRNLRWRSQDKTALAKLCKRFTKEQIIRQIERGVSVAKQARPKIKDPERADRLEEAMRFTKEYNSRKLGYKGLIRNFGDKALYDMYQEEHSADARGEGFKKWKETARKTISAGNKGLEKQLEKTINLNSSTETR